MRRRSSAVPTTCWWLTHPAAITGVSVGARWNSPGGCSSNRLVYLRDGFAQFYVLPHRDRIAVYWHRDSHSVDPITPGAWQGSHWSANFYVTGMTRPGKILQQRAGVESQISRSLGGHLNQLANETVVTMARPACEHGMVNDQAQPGWHLLLHTGCDTDSLENTAWTWNASFNDCRFTVSDAHRNSHQKHGLLSYSFRIFVFALSASSSLSVSVSPSPILSLSVFACLSVCLFVCLPACLPACLSACLPACLNAWMPAYPPPPLSLSLFFLCFAVSFSVSLCSRERRMGWGGGGGGGGSGWVSFFLFLVFFAFFMQSLFLFHPLRYFFSFVVLCYHSNWQSV